MLLSDRSTASAEEVSEVDRVHGGASFLVQGRSFSDPKVNGPIEISVVFVDGRVQHDVTVAVEKLQTEKILSFIWGGTKAPLTKEIVVLTASNNTFTPLSPPPPPPPLSP